MFQSTTRKVVSRKQEGTAVLLCPDAAPTIESCADDADVPFCISESDKTKTSSQAHTNTLQFAVYCCVLYTLYYQTTNVL